MKGISKVDIDIVKGTHRSGMDISNREYWKGVKKYFCLYYPELIKAMDQLELAQDTLDSIIEGLEYEDD